jgi:DNA repair protein RecO (recombination protein O)
MSETNRLSGIVLNKINYLENDQIIDFYTLEKGKVEILVRGGRKINSKLAPIVTEPFSLLVLTVAAGKNYFHLIGGEKKQRFLGILERKSQSLKLYSLFKKIDQLIKSEPDKKIFSLIIKFLEVIDQSSEKSFLAVTNAFLIKFLSFLGYRPEIKKCLICQKEIKGLKMFFNFRKGGVVCLHHPLDKNFEKTEAIIINQTLLNILQKLLYQNFSLIIKNSFKETDLVKTGNLIKKFFVWHLN